MARRLTIKDHVGEARLFGNRVIVGLVFMALLLTLLVARLVQLQVLSHEHFTTLSKNNRVRVLPIPPTRGLIYDREGILLAENQPSFSLEIVPEKVDDIDATLQRLGALITITDEDIERFQRLKQKKRRFESVPLRLRLSEDEVAIFFVNRHRFPGVDIRAGLVRHYPHGPLAAHVIGYVGRVDEADLRQVDVSNYSGTTHIGKVGVERSYEDDLHGTVGYQHVETNAQGRILRILERSSPQPGKNIYLTMDTRLQAAAEAALGERRGAVVALDPSTGDVLALASMPSYDPNLFVNGIDSKTYRSLQQSQQKPLFNRALLGQYPPGSTIKPMVGLAGLNYGVINTEQPTYCPGWYQLKGNAHKYRDWKRGGHGPVDLNVAIVQSCDVYFYDLARNLGIDRLHAFLSQFGFGRRTGIDILGERSGLMPSREWKRRARQQPWYPGETLIAGIGQGFTLVTPLQLAHAVAVVASRGVPAVPRVVDAIEDPVARTVNQLEPRYEASVQLANPSNWDFVIDAMVEVVHGKRGTARRIGLDAPYTIAGKTGTAQVFGIKQDEKYNADELEEHLRDHSLFIAFAPADEPRIALAVMVENGGSGSAVAAPIARQVMDHFFLGTTVAGKTP